MKYPDHISNSQLQAFRRSPAHWVQYISEKKMRTDAMLLGSLCHCLALQPGEVKTKFLLVDGLKPEPEKDYRNAKNRDWKAEWVEKAETAKLDLIMPEILLQASEAVKALHDDSEAPRFLDGEKEAKLEWACLGLNFMGIRDVSSDKYITDLKFVNNADPRVFQRELWKNGVPRQGGMYLDGEMKGEFTGEPHKQVYFIAVETEPPYGISVNELDYEVINFGVNEYRMLAAGLKSCMDANHFPSYSYRNINGTFDVNLPNFVMTE